MRHPHGETVTVDRPGGFDRNGDPLPGTTHTVDGCAFDDGQTSEFNSLGERVVTEPVIYGPPDGNFLSTDKVTRATDTAPWYVQGDPSRPTNPFTGSRPGCVVKLSRQRG